MGREEFIGSWKLVSAEYKDSAGKVNYPLGKEVTGLLMYDKDGYLSAQLVSFSRPPFASGDPLKGTPQEIKAAFGSCITYYGTYEVHETEHLGQIEPPPCTLKST